MDANYRVSAIASHLSSSAALQGPLPSASGAQPPVRRLDQPELIKKDLKELGFTAVQVIDKESEIQALRDGIWDMLEALLPGKLSRNNPETWRDSNWPIASRGLIHRYGAPHSPVAWAGRTHPGVLKAWEIVWGTKELITSYDAVGMMRPVEVLKKLGEEVPKLGYWAHVDHDEGGEEVELIQVGVVTSSLLTPNESLTIPQLDRASSISTNRDQKTEAWSSTWDPDRHILTGGPRD